MLGISATRLVIYGIIAAVVIGACWMLRDELIAKGENIIKAQDNAALVKAQQQQTKDDAERLKGQAVYIEHLESQGTQIKEKIRYVQPPPSCPNDGRTDPRVGDTVDWLRGGAGDNGAAPGGPQPKAAVPATR